MSADKPVTVEDARAALTDLGNERMDGRSHRFIWRGVVGISGVKVLNALTRRAAAQEDALRLLEQAALDLDATLLYQDITYGMGGSKTKRTLDYEVPVRHFPQIDQG